MEVCILVVFHKEGCPYCPPALEAANKVKTAHVVNISSDHPIVKDLTITSFPTIWLSYPNTLYDYGTKERTAAALTQYIQDKTDSVRAILI